MKALATIISLVLIIYATKAQTQALPEFDSYDSLFAAVFRNNDTTYVINFWATWCAPCVKELPYFEAFNKKYKKQKFKVVLVSLDFKRQIKSHLLPFITKNKIASEVVIMNDKKYDTWLPKVDASWSGSIPATYLVQGDKKLFAEREFANLEELEDFIFSFSKYK
jgi:thiol-disulfide isomerase/thioredoxin